MRIIRQTLTSHLFDMPPPAAVAWNGRAFDPNYGDAWLRPSYNNAEPDQAELGTNGRNEHVGFYQIDIFAPRVVSDSVIEQMADALVERFKRGSVLTYSGADIRIDKAWWRYGQDPNWDKRIIVRSDYRAYLPN